LFWNLAFWFKYANLPHVWMAPYAGHLDSHDESSGEDPNPKEYFKKFIVEKTRKIMNELKIGRVEGEPNNNHNIGS